MIMLGSTKTMAIDRALICIVCKRFASRTFLALFHLTLSGLFCRPINGINVTVYSENKFIFADEPSPPPYTEQPAGGAPSGYQSQPGYPAEVDQPPPKGGYLAPQPYNAQPARGPHPFAVQHGYPLQTMQPVPVQQTSTVIMQVSFLPVQGMLHVNHVRFVLLCIMHH